MKKKDIENVMDRKPHGIMFHHFIGKGHPQAQGAISVRQFRRIIDYYGDRLLSAEQWYSKAINNSFKDNDICLTFDDSLLCQYEIVLPILKEYGLKAFWFVYSSVLTGEIEMLEVYRKFRLESFKDINHFYKNFFLVINNSSYNNEVKESLKYYSHDDWKEFPFYSKNDTKFRFLRNSVLDSERYNQIMNKMMKKQKINLTEFSSNLWMSKKHVKKLKSQGHIIGLHTHTHPTNLARLNTLEQEKEYQLNFDILYNHLGEKPQTMSHPCNSYNDQTLKILDNLGIKIGFRATMKKIKHSKLEFPRENHANVIRKIENYTSIR